VSVSTAIAARDNISSMVVLHVSLALSDLPPAGSVLSGTPDVVADKSLQT
jgi:hypothetical protein